MNGEKGLLAALANAVVNMEEEGAAELSRKALDMGIDPSEVLFQGILKGMGMASDLYECGEYFVPELLLCSDALYAGLKVVKPHLPQESFGAFGRVVIGVVQGDTHDIGKNIVRIMLEGAGFEVVDLGRDVPYNTFIDAALTHNANVIALSTLMTTSMDGMGIVIGKLLERGVRDRFKVVVGGAPISPAFANRIGADGYAPNAPAAVDLVKSLLSTHVTAG